jgi:hypothetical protein
VVIIFVEEIFVAVVNPLLTSLASLKYLVVTKYNVP